jgi:kynurenine formamidase
MKRTIALLTASFCLTGSVLLAQNLKGWTQGKGFGWIWGPNDTVGALNAILTPERTLKALQSVKTGKVYDLGVPVDQFSYKFAGHSPTSIVSYRSPEGVKRGGDLQGLGEDHAHKLAFHSCALYISDNLGTQIDGLGHITTGADNHWYNGFREAEWGGDFGIRKADADGIPPVIGRGVLIDVAAWKGVDALPSNFPITSKELRGALEAQKIDVAPGDIVMIRTGTLRYWGENGSNHAKIAEHDSAGLTLEGAKWLVEQKGAVLVGSDTSGVECANDPALPGAVNPVHEYLLVEQGVHLGEFHNLEGLSASKAYRFVYVAMTNRIKGTVAGTAMRPIAME